MDEIPAQPVEANRLKPKQDFEVSMKNMYLMAFPSTVTTFSCACDRLSQFLVQDKWGERGNKSTLQGMACASGWGWTWLGWERLTVAGEGVCLCCPPAFSPPQRKITAGNSGEVTWSPSANLGRFALLSVSSCFDARLHNAHSGCS